MDDESPCSDRYCILRVGPVTGMATNGGCQHLRMSDREIIRLLRRVVLARGDALAAADRLAEAVERTAHGPGPLAIEALAGALAAYRAARGAR